MKGCKTYKGYIYFYGTTYHKNSKATKTYTKKNQIIYSFIMLLFFFSKTKDIKDYLKLSYDMYNALYIALFIRPSKVQKSSKIPVNIVLIKHYTA